MIFVLVEFLVSLLVFGAVVCLMWGLFRYPVPVEPPIHRQIALALGTGQRQTLFEQPTLGAILTMALSVARRFSFPPLRNFIHTNLNASGNPNNYSVDEYLALCLLCGVTLGLLGGGVLLLVLRSVEIFTPAALMVVGFAVPLWTLHSAATSRLVRISKKLPYTLDLIALMMAAGSTFTEAIEVILRDEPNDDFNQELRIVQAEVEFGATRAAALQNMSIRVPLDTLRSIVGAINQAEALGTPLSVILKTQSGMLRMHRSIRAEKLSASASMRILLPLMLILIAVVFIVFGPLLVRWAASGFQSTLG